MLQMGVESMNKEDRQFLKRIDELSERAEKRRSRECSDFLSLAEQSVLLGNAPYNCRLWGGYEAAERKLALFDEWHDEHIEADEQLVLIKIAPVNAKFSDALTHRDFLGSLMNMGLRRECFGDIVLQGNTAYLFCMAEVREYVLQNIDRVKHTTVKTELVQSLPAEITERATVQSYSVNSLRLDALIGAVYKLSRSEAKDLIEAEGKAYINGRETQNAAAQVCDGDMVSLRGYGRFRYEGTSGETRKGRLRVDLKVY